MPDPLQTCVLDSIIAADVEVAPIDGGIKFMRGVMDKYGDLPCDFTDASLVYAASRTGLREIWTLDRDFLIFRLPDRGSFTLIPGGK